MPESGTSNLSLVTESESGQKLLRFLERRLSLPRNLLHRWLRTGQIRLNGKRAKPFDPVVCGDSVRVPPFACKLAANPGHDFACEGELPPLLGRHGSIWAFNKPAGLAVQPGTGITTSLAGILASHYRDLPFCPSPGHRLDRDTSGVLLVGASHEALRSLQQMFANGLMHKEYLAWVAGAVQWQSDTVLRHYLAGRDQVRAENTSQPGSSEAICVVRPLAINDGRSLLQIRLMTGRKRQIRSQLHACGHPVLGDNRYGSEQGHLKLHACRAILPDGTEFSCLPDWRGEYEVLSLPPKMELAKSISQKTEVI